MVERTSSFYAIKFVEGPQVRYSLASQQPQIYSVKAVMKGGFNSEYSIKTKESQVTAYAVKAQELMKQEYVVTAKVVRSNELLYPIVAKSQKVVEYGVVARDQVVTEYPISSITYHESIEMKGFGTAQRSTIRHISIFDAVAAERVAMVSALMHDVQASHIKTDREIDVIDLKAVTASRLLEMMLHQSKLAERSQTHGIDIKSHNKVELYGIKDSEHIKMRTTTVHREKDARRIKFKDAAPYKVRDIKQADIVKSHRYSELVEDTVDLKTAAIDRVQDVEIVSFKTMSFENVEQMSVSGYRVASFNSTKESIYSAKPYTGGKFGDELHIINYERATFNNIRDAEKAVFKVAGFSILKNAERTRYKVANFNNVKNVDNVSYGIFNFNNVKNAELSHFKAFDFSNVKDSECAAVDVAAYHQGQSATLVNNERAILSTAHDTQFVDIEKALFSQRLLADIEKVRASLVHCEINVDLIELKAIVAIREFLTNNKDIAVSERLKDMYGARLVNLAASTIDRACETEMDKAKGGDSQGPELEIINYKKARIDRVLDADNVDYERGTFERVREIDHVKHETALINRSVDAIRVDYKDATLSRKLKAQCIDVKDAVNYRVLHTQNTNFKTTSAPKKSLVIVDKERGLYEKVDSVDIVNIERAEYRKIEFIDIISIEKALPPFKEISNVEKEKGLLSTEQFIDHTDLEKALRNKQHVIDINEIEKALIAPVEMDLTRYKTGAYATEHIIDIVDIQVATEPDRKKKKKIWLHMGKSSWLPSMKQWKTR